MAYVIALAGKGGTGKTTLAALMIRQITEGLGKAVLAVDADPNSCLGEALGAMPERTIADIREGARNDELNLAPGMSKERQIEFLIQNCVVEGRKFDLLTMGRPEGPKCYCYVNNLLRKYLDRVSTDYPFVVIDNEAGMEHLSRLTTNNVDDLWVVSDATAQGARTVGRIMKIADELPILVKRRAVVLNCTVPEGDSAACRQAVEAGGGRVTLEIPYDPVLYRLRAAAKPIYDLPADAAAFGAVREFMNSRMK